MKSFCDKFGLKDSASFNTCHFVTVKAANQHLLSVPKQALRAARELMAQNALAVLCDLIRLFQCDCADFHFIPLSSPLQSAGDLQKLRNQF